MGLFVAVGQQALRIASKDGVAWTHEEIGKEGETLRAVAYGNGIFAAVGGFGWGDQLMAYSRDGLDWHITPKTKQTNYDTKNNYSVKHTSNDTTTTPKQKTTTNQKQHMRKTKQ